MESIANALIIIGIAVPVLTFGTIIILGILGIMFVKSGKPGTPERLDEVDGYYVRVNGEVRVND